MTNSSFLKKFCLFLILCIFSISFYMFKLSDSIPIQFNIKWNAESPHLILLWAPIPAHDVNKIVREFGVIKCPFQCEFTEDKSLANEANAIVFRGDAHFIKHFPYLRDPSQVWILLRYESPGYVALNPLPLEKPHRKYPYFFNLTASYRRDSDLYHPYGSFIKKQTNESHIPTIDSIKSKKLVSWMVSNCNTIIRRETFVKDLQKILPVDIYGGCGPLKCDGDNCYKTLGDQYKFYLSLENSYCVDYVTEKFFNPLKNGMVPIVLGGANYSAIAPPGSYINVDDFDTVQELANYLTYLDRNPQEYLKFFEWKRDYEIKDSEIVELFCEVCRRLKVYGNNTMIRKSYQDMKNWWYQSPIDGSSACKIPKLPEFLNDKNVS